MKNLDKLYFECEKELRRINMDFSEYIRKVSVNGRLRTTLGVCHYDYRTGWYTIEINPCLLADNVNDMEIKDTIIHEMIHTCPNCMSHGYEWKRRADRVNRMLGYHVSRCASVKGLLEAGVKDMREPYKYALECVDCGKQFKYRRWCASLENPSRYRCGKCHGNLKTICLDGSVAICGFGFKAACKSE